MMRHCARGNVNGEGIIRGEMDCERSVIDTKMVRSFFVTTTMANTGSVEDGNKVA